MSTRTRTFLTLAVVAMACFAMTTSANATLIQNNTLGTVAASGTDLMTTSLSGVTKGGNWRIGGNDGGSGDPAVLYDGLASSNSGVNRYQSTSAYYMVPIYQSAIVTITLDTVAATGGYDITALDFYHGWQNTGRDGFQFTIEYSTVGDAGFTTYGTTVYYDPGNPYYGRTGVTDSTGTIASGVDQIRITFPRIQNTYGGLSEIDVFGTAVPEPATMSLLALGGLGVLLKRRRRRA